MTRRDPHRDEVASSSAALYRVRVKAGNAAWETCALSSGASRTYGPSTPAARGGSAPCGRRRRLLRGRLQRALRLQRVDGVALRATLGRGAHVRRHGGSSSSFTAVAVAALHVVLKGSDCDRSRRAGRIARSLSRCWRTVWYGSAHLQSILTPSNSGRWAFPGNARAGLRSMAATFLKASFRDRKELFVQRRPS